MVNLGASLEGKAVISLSFPDVPNLGHQKERGSPMNILDIVEQARSEHEAQAAAQAEAAAQQQAKMDKRAALFARLDGLLAEINLGYQNKNWAAKDRACVRILALTSHHLEQGGNAKFRLRLVWYACRAYSALHPTAAKKHLQRFEEAVLRHLADVKEMPDWVPKAMKNVYHRASQANLSPGVRKTIAHGVPTNPDQPVKKPAGKRQNGGRQTDRPKGDRRRPAARARLEQQFGEGGSAGPILVATAGESGPGAMALALADAGLNGSAKAEAAA